MRTEEFGPEKVWWENRKEDEYAWKVAIEQLKASGYNLDIKNPHVGELESHDPDEMLMKYKKIMAEVAETREALKNQL
ncbi:MAG: SAM-dependent methyltransferase [Desulfobulbaceae bacterium]|nr:SAM-dependent methyltransferase [Desulfobulbaceae bacterium]HIJ91591.1 hypothetical protein [Deltaproteobacteria bacterium]